MPAPDIEPTRRQDRVRRRDRVDGSHPPAGSGNAEALASGTPTRAEVNVASALRPSPLTALHRADGAKLAPFAGWEMPLEFEGTLAEHRAVRSDVGVFDVSHLGTVVVTGPDAEAVVAATFTNDPAQLEDGTSQYSLCCDADGGIVDDLIVYRLGPERFVTVPNAANNDAVVTRLRDAAATRAADVDDVGPDRAILAVQGPEALGLVAEVVGADPFSVGYLGVAEIAHRGADLLLCRTGYTGEVGCELVAPAEAAADLWQALRSRGAVACGLGARDTLRLEMGYPLHGQDLSRDTDPYEARLGWAVKLDRGPFTGQEALRSAKEQGPARRLWGLLGTSRRPPRHGMDVRREGQRVGTVTSGSFSPTLEVGIGLAYLDDPIGPDDEVEVDVRGTGVPFTVVRPPFVDRDPSG